MDRMIFMDPRKNIIITAFFLMLTTMASAGEVRSVNTVSGASASGKSSIMIAAVGDVMMPGSLQDAMAKNDNNYDLLFEKIAKDLGAADLTFANLETPVDHTAAVAGYPAFNSRPELLRALKKSGVDIVSLANNHVGDAGAGGLLRTLQNIEAAGLAVVGAGKTRKESLSTVYLSSRNMVTAFLAYTYGTNLSPLNKRKSGPAVNILRPDSRADLDAAITQVKRARKRADLIVVSIHWGDEYEAVPSLWQKQAATELVESGADVILGHHPHVLQPLESHTTKDGRRTVIAYSLGNFISSQSRGPSSKDAAHDRALRGDGVILLIYAEKDAGKTAVVRSAFQPIWSLREKVGKATTFRPVSLPREIGKLAARAKRSKREEGVLQLLTHRQKVIEATINATPVP